MKKIILTLLCLFVTLTVVACGNDTAETKESATKASTEKITEEKTSEEKTSNVETEAPTESPTEAPTEAPTEQPTEVPTEAPTEQPTEAPTEQPTEAPTEAPTEQPTEAPTEAPTEQVTEEPVELPTDGPTIASPAYEALHKVHYYESYEKFVDSLKNYNKDTLEKINDVEMKYLFDTSKKTHLTSAEIKDGLFNSFRNNIINNDKIMLPYINGEFVCKIPKNDQCIKLYTAYNTSRKPTITFSTQYSIGIATTYIDHSLAQEAVLKGGAWLSSIVAPEMINVDNQEEFIDMYLSQGIESAKYISVYEKEYSLADRTVLAMVLENASNSDNPGLNVYFVYDDIYVYVFGRESVVEETLKNLTFYECEFSTGKPLRNTPGRTAEYLAEK